MPEVHEACERLVEDGLVRAYGVSVEKVEQALKAIEYDGVATIQIIFNMLRQRPAEHFFAEAKRRDVGVIVRVPLASGLLTGKFDRDSTFAEDDHRRYNRHGEEFDMGETFSGVDYELGLEVVEELRPLVPEGATLAQLALRWILTFDGVSTVIPGAKTPGAGAGERGCGRSAPAVRRRRWSGSRRSTASGSPRSSTSAGEPQAGSISCAPSTEAQTYGVASRPARAAYSRVTASARPCA